MRPEEAAPKMAPSPIRPRPAEATAVSGTDVDEVDVEAAATTTAPAQEETPDKTGAEIVAEAADDAEEAGGAPEEAIDTTGRELDDAAVVIAVDDVAVVIAVEVRVDTDVDISTLVLKRPEETLTVHVGIVDVDPKTTIG